MNVVPMSPITSVKLLRNVPLDNTYKDTLKFSDVSSQISYFTGKVKYTFANLAPVRLQNAIRIPTTADNLYDCNYIMFQNANFGNKWFYAFIKAINFENVNMCTVEFEMDVYQTWQFDITVKPSLVLREHSSTDAVGDNLVSESIDIGYYREEVAQKTGYFDNYTAVIATSYDGTDTVGGMKGGLFSGVNYVGASINTPGEVDLLLGYLDAITTANKVDAITSLFMMPTAFFTNGELPVMARFDARMNKTSIGSYIPKNKKLLTYPYNFLYVYTPDGANAIYRYEYFRSNVECGFALFSSMSCNPEIVAIPIAYQNQDFNFDESLTMGNFPQCSYSIDSFKAYLAQNSTSTLINVGIAGLSASTGNVVGAMTGVVASASSINGLVQASMKPPMVRGSQGTSTFTATRDKDFYFVNKHISEEYARIIDEYFSMFGYATNRVKVPNMTGRPSWNFVKTDGVKIVGSVPFNDIARIKEMFDTGVTFWHGDWVGDYTRNNAI